jgi:YgiT-type zinc finger domain-containing protein
MTCVICEIGETEPGMATLTFEKDGTIIVIKNVPADICPICGESYTDQDVTRRLLQMVNEEVQKGAKDEFIQYAA